MSKAFTRETDDAPEMPIFRRPSLLPNGTRNYMTPDGAKRLEQELTRLLQEERPQLAGSSTEEARQQLQSLDRRIQQLQETLETAVIVPPPDPSDHRVRFGARVTVREQNGTETQYRIVGIDETDLDRNWISWLSPLARALSNASSGQRVRIKLPTGETELEVIRVEYE